jgi:hypothetical protein
VGRVWPRHGHRGRPLNSVVRQLVRNVETAILGAFISAVVVGAFAIFAHTLVYVGLRRRGVPIQFGWSGMPGYLHRLCRQLPPLPENVRLAGLAKWSEIALVLAFAVGVITGPLVGQLPK